ncbi:MAG: RbsD/FucU domain-containing protein [Clostridia bacterium]|nr:RbsD/FucU domain-containing protein [Clostridia bacterium]
MLKNIPKIIPPDLLKILCEMGHGDELVIADGNFPAAEMGRRVVYLSGNDAAEVFEAVLQLLPLDTYAQPLFLMEKVAGDTVETPIWDAYKKIAKKYSDADFEKIDRFEFYERARKAYAVISTGEGALYANILLKKGVIQ